MCHSISVYGYYSLLVWRIGIWSDGNKIVFGEMPTVEDFVRCDAGSLWFVIIPKSKDWIV
jgi:hypothetical protein